MNIGPAHNEHSDDLKQAAEELRRNEAYLAEAQRLSLTGSFGWNVSTGEIIWSKETYCILGYDRGDRAIGSSEGCGGAK